MYHYKSTHYSESAKYQEREDISLSIPTMVWNVGKFQRYIAEISVIRDSQHDISQRKSVSWFFLDISALSLIFWEIYQIFSKSTRVNDRACNAYIRVSWFFRKSTRVNVSWFFKKSTRVNDRACNACVKGFAPTTPIQIFLPPKACTQEDSNPSKRLGLEAIYHWAKCMFVNIHAQ